jgi:hypothetical protein
LVWFTTSSVAIEMAATAIAMMTGFRRIISMHVNSNWRGGVPASVALPVGKRPQGLNGTPTAPLT